MRAIALLVLSALLQPALAGTAPRSLMWEEMVPAKPKVGGSELALTSQAPVLSLDGEYVRLPGFVVPLESDEGGLISEFLLVPYFGACIHVPPPPPNQIVYVTLDEPFNLVSLQQPYWIQGRLLVETYASEVAATAYTLRADRIEKYDY